MSPRPGRVRRAVRGPARRIRRRLRTSFGIDASVRRVSHDDAHAILLRSSLFDESWYSLVAGRELGRAEAVAHYLDRGHGAGLSPHPLLDPAVIGQGLELEDATVEPVSAYLARRAFHVPTHPLFDLDRYLQAYPTATEHVDGPVAHYRDVGAPAGAQINDWFEPTPGTDGLVEWLRRDAQDWARRRRPVLATWTKEVPQLVDHPSPPVPDGVRVSVVLLAEHGGEDLAATVGSLLAQPDPGWELCVVTLDTSPEVTELRSQLPDDDRVVLLDRRSPTRAAGRNAGAAAATGTHVTWVSEGDRWVAGRMRHLAAALGPDQRWSYDVARDDHADPPAYAVRQLRRARLATGALPELSTLLVDATLLHDVGGFDESLAAGHVLDLVLRLLDRHEGVHVRRLGVTVERTPARQRRRFPPTTRRLIDAEHVGSAADIALNRELVDWAALAETVTRPDVISVVIPTHHDWEMTRRAVARVIEHRDGRTVQVIVVDNGCPVTASAALAALVEEHDDVEVLRSPVNRGFALGNNAALPLAHGSTLVFLNNDTEVQAGWLEPLVEALARPEVLAAQSLLRYPGGAVQSAGVVFPRGGGVPHELLRGFPVEDAEGVRGVELRALTGAALAVRHADVVALRGFDPLFRNGMEDVDLCLRLGELRPGHFEVCPDSQVLHHESKSPGRFASSVVNRRLLVDRWAGRWPQDGVTAWSACGYEVMGHRPRPGQDNLLGTSDPVLRLRPRVSVLEGVPRLRWALKNPAPAGLLGEHWGDTHFARHLAEALRGLGQEVVIDHRPEFDRPSSWHDDVVLLLRGLARYAPAPDRVNLTWLISHPDMWEPSEHLGYDRVYVASATFAGRLAATGVPARTLLQAADVALFHPSRAAPDTGDRILFVGSSRKRMRTMPQWAIEQGLDLTVFGQDWEGLIPDELVRAPYLPNADLGAAYRSAGVVLNDHWHDMAEHGFLSNRLFDAVAAGARVVSDPVPGLEEVFGDAVQVAHDASELARLVGAADLDAVFGSDDVRRERASAVARDHSFSARAKVLLDDALQLRAHRLRP